MERVKHNELRLHSSALRSRIAPTIRLLGAEAL